MIFSYGSYLNRKNIFSHYLGLNTDYLKIQGFLNNH